MPFKGKAPFVLPLYCSGLTFCSFNVLFILFFFVPYSSPAQHKNVAPKWQVVHYDEQKGLDSKGVYGLVLDKNGLGWLGNEQGLNIFDGKNVYPLGNFIQSEPMLFALPVSALHYDSSLHCLFILAQKINKTVLYTVDLTMLGHQQFAAKELVNMGGYLNDNPIFGQNRIVCLVGTQVHMIILYKDRLKKSVTNQTFKAKHLFAMPGIGYFADNFKGTALYQLRLDKDSLYADFIANLQSTEHRDLFFSQGVYTAKAGKKYVNAELISRNELAHIAKEAGLSKEYEADGTFVEDGKGNYYLYSKLGLQKVSARLPVIEGYTLMQKEARSIVYEGSGRCCYICTSGSIFPFDMKTRRFEDTLKIKEENYFCAAHQLNDSQLAFFGIDPPNAVLLDKRTKKFSETNLNINRKIYFSYPAKSPNTAYFATDSGLYKGVYSQNEFIFEEIDFGVQDEIQGIVSNSNNSIILAGLKGLYQYNTQNHKLKVIAAGNFFCVQMLGKNLVAGTSNKGAMVFNESLELTHVINTGNGLKSNLVYSLLCDSVLNAIWLGTVNGLTVYHLSTGIHKTYTTNDGLPHNEFNRSSTYQFKGDSLLMMGGIKGISLIHNRAPFLLQDSIVPKPIPWSINVTYANLKEQNEWLNVENTSILNFEKNINKLAIKMANPAGEKIYATAYKLDDDEWKYLKAGDNIELLSPANGNHIILLKSVMANQKESEEIIVRFKIEMEWYKKTWGILLIGFSAIALILPVFYVRERYLRQKNQLLINKNKERLFAIIAHDLRSPIKTYQNLTDIFTYLIEQQDWDSLRKVSENIDTTGQKLDLLLENLLNWSLLEQKELKPVIQVCNVTKVSKNLVELYEVIAEKRSIRLRNSVEEHLVIQTDANLLSLIFRNLLDNAVKNASSFSVIDITITLEKKILVIEISNTFNIEKLDAAENLINNIKSPDKTEGRGIGMKFIAHALVLLKGEVKAKMHESENKITITITIPVL